MINIVPASADASMQIVVMDYVAYKIWWSLIDVIFDAVIE